MHWPTRLSGAATVLLALLVVGLPAIPTRAATSVAGVVSGTEAFDCGPHALTYVVLPTDDKRSGMGVRCLKLLSKDYSYQIVWYGEGRWDNRAYRHLGMAYAAIEEWTPIESYAADISGNGEAYSSVTHTLFVEPVIGSWPVPKRISVEGDWHELWVLASQLPGTLSYVPLPRPTTCGPHLEEYMVTALDGRSGAGLRCLLHERWRSGSGVWFGNGEWGGTRYTHVGAFRPYLPGSQLASAWDLCHPHFGQFCSKVPTGIPVAGPGANLVDELLMKDVAAGYDLTWQGWNEAWRRP